MLFGAWYDCALDRFPAQPERLGEQRHRGRHRRDALPRRACSTTRAGGSLVYEDATLRSGGREWMLEQVRDHCRGITEKSDYPVKACGISFGGPVDFERQRVDLPSRRPAGRISPWPQWAQETLGLPCRLDNDANAGALGEFRLRCRSRHCVRWSTSRSAPASAAA